MRCAVAGLVGSQGGSMQAQRQRTAVESGDSDAQPAGSTAVRAWRQRDCPWCGSGRAECSTSSRYTTVMWVCGVCTMFEVAWGTVAWLEAEAAKSPEHWTRVRQAMSNRLRTSNRQDVITPEVLMTVADELMSRR